MSGRVLVTGGSRGLGLAIARGLADGGYAVTAIARRLSDPLAAAIDEVSEKGTGSLRFQAFDLADIAGIPKLVTCLRKDTGPIYGLVNNAGIGTSGALALMHNTEIETLLRINTLSPIVLTKYVVRHMMADGGGRVVSIASITAVTGLSGLSVYSATKAALVGFTRSLAREVGRLGVTVNAIAPGFVDTEMTESLEGGTRDQIVRRSALKRLADANDVAAAAAFLLGPGARNITGTVLTVDAGATA